MHPIIIRIWILIYILTIIIFFITIVEESIYPFIIFLIIIRGLSILILYFTRLIINNKLLNFKKNYLWNFIIRLFILKIFSNTYDNKIIVNLHQINLLLIDNIEIIFIKKNLFISLLIIFILLILIFLIIKIIFSLNKSIRKFY